MTLVIETERLVLSPITMSDIDICTELFTDQRVMNYLWDVETAEEIRDSMKIITKRASRGAIGVWIISDNKTGEKHGTAAILPLPVEENNTKWDLIENDNCAGHDLEIGYILKPKAWGRGIATEAAKSIVDYGFSNIMINQLVAVIDDENHSSRRVLNKIGMTEVGIRKAYGGMSPRFELTRQEWEGKSGHV